MTIAAVVSVPERMFQCERDRHFEVFTPREALAPEHGGSRADGPDRCQRDGACLEERGGCDQVPGPRDER